MKKYLLALAIGLVSMMSLSSCTRVDSGNEALKVDQFGNSKGEPVAVEVRGMVFYNPWTQDVFEYPTYMQHVAYENVQFTTKDGSLFTANPAFNYSMKKGRAVNVFTTYRKSIGDIEEGFMMAAVQDAYVRVGNSYTSDSLMASRATFEDKMMKELSSKIGDDFNVSQLVSNMVPPQSLVDAINTKNKLVQEGLAEQNKVVKAVAAAQVKLANARGDSAQKVIAAQADARAYELQTRSLNDKILQKMYIEKWKGDYGTGNVYGAGTNIMKNLQ